MRALDPEDDSPSPAGAQDTQSSDQSKSGLRAAWDAWTSRPENNAALLQTGLALLQPRSPGQSAVGQFANAVGQGAEASERNVAGQQAEAKAQAEQEVKRREADARETTAGAYADQVKQGGGGKGGDKEKTLRLQDQLKRQALTEKNFQGWLSGKDFYMDDPTLDAVKKAFPDVKSKADLLGNGAALTYARKLYKQNFSEPSEQEGEGESASPPTTTDPNGPPAPQPRIIYDRQGKAFQWDGVQGHPPVPM